MKDKWEQNAYHLAIPTFFFYEFSHFTFSYSLLNKLYNKHLYLILSLTNSVINIIRISKLWGFTIHLVDRIQSEGPISTYILRKIMLFHFFFPEIEIWDYAHLKSMRCIHPLPYHILENINFIFVVWFLSKRIGKT